MLARNFLLTWFIVMVSLEINAQPWFKGSLTLTNSRIVSGEISYQFNTDVVFVKMGGKESVMVFPAFRVEYFVYYDKDAQAQRKFVPLKISKGAGQHYQFYEVIVDGRISVVRQQNEMWYSLRQPTIEYTYFVLTEESLMPLNVFRREVYRTLKKSSPEMQEFVRKNRINPYDVDDTIQFIRFYNAEQSGLASTR
jgi:hypothetical protein